METRTRNSQRKTHGCQTVAEPLIHRFQTERNKYIFDSNTGEILRVDDVVWAIAPDSYLSQDELISKYVPQFSPAQIVQAHDEIRTVQTEEGYLLNHHPEVGLRISRERVHQLLGAEREQLGLNVTEGCNFRCAYCYYSLSDTGVRTHGQRNMSWETAKAAIDDFLEHCRVPKSPPEDDGQRGYGPWRISPVKKTIRDEDVPPCISFYGGEPLLNFPLIKKCTEYTLEKTKGKTIGFQMSTNGSLLKGEAAEFLGAHHFSIRISIDGPPSIHDQYRRTASGSPTWAMVVDNMRRYLAKNPSYLPFIGATVARTANYLDVCTYLATADWIPPIALVDVNLASDPFPGYYEPADEEQPRPGICEAHERYMRNLVKGRFNLYVNDREFTMQRNLFAGELQRLHQNRWGCAVHRHLPAKVMPGGVCVAGSRKTFVSVSGDYYPCERVEECETCRIGNVSTGIDEDKVYALLKEFVDCTREECQRCWCVPICAIGCYATVQSKGGYTAAAKQRACPGVRDQAHMRLIDYCTVMEKNPHAFDYLTHETVEKQKSSA